MMAKRLTTSSGIYCNAYLEMRRELRDCSDAELRKAIGEAQALIEGTQPINKRGLSVPTASWWTSMAQIDAATDLLMERSVRTVEPSPIPSAKGE
ncbi:hypothetical protein TSH58p_17430 [Azospirillum sp. TSH58]|uniref:hypothetical protein n=1 Tax=Azospirillum sp. TSH58 TaxID=664962 RepID=UPI000D6031C0|nr:hypothetical protein [Azospirillum sp. TSH58]AWJ85147.1 hypothetical protein TSH58p_17430 [Azospirillum sp. TSH58]PWC80822.1 hypothetical protein TSH58_00835 [Azospirillum sp. TSH58]